MEEEKIVKEVIQKVLNQRRNKTFTLSKIIKECCNVSEEEEKAIAVIVLKKLQGSTPNLVRSKASNNSVLPQDIPLKIEYDYNIFTKNKIIKQIPEQLKDSVYCTFGFVLGKQKLSKELEEDYINFLHMIHKEKNKKLIDE